MSKYLITGIAGFIGSSIARVLVLQGHEVRGVDNLSTGRIDNLAGLLDKVDFRQADLCDLEAIANACAGIDYVLHEAAIPSVPKSVLDPISCNRANVDGTVNLLVAARDARVKRVIYAASSSAYGDSRALPKREDMLPSPISPYAVAKLAGEHYMKAFYHCYGLETICLRYFNVFGPGQDPSSPYSGVLSQFISRALKGESLTIFGDGEQSRDFTYVDNVVIANLLACGATNSAAGKVFNIASGNSITLNEAAAKIKRLAAYEGQTIYQSARDGDVRHSLADLSSASVHLGYGPKIGFDKGLEITMEWYRSGLKGLSGSRSA
jgi:nucleoside-diphosphate-sugar epimerase